jgi:hypothetical protein
VTNFGVGPVIGDKVTAETTWAARIDPAFFDVLGVQPLFGGFREEHYSRPFEFGKLSAQPAIISYRLWRRLGGVSGRRPGGLLRVGDGTLDIVGVLPPDFVFPMPFASAGQPRRPISRAQDGMNIAPHARRGRRAASRVPRDAQPRFNSSRDYFPQFINKGMSQFLR